MSRRMIFPLLLGLVGVAILLGLGVWQLQRLAWKQAMLAEINAMIVDAPVPLPAAPDSKSDRYRPVIASGRFTGEAAEVLDSVRDVGPGARLIGVFETAEGRRILVDRGLRLDADRGALPPGHTADIVGNLDWPQETDSYTPPPDARSGMWFAVDVPAMAKALNTEATFIVARGPTGDGISPVPVDTSAIPNDHLQYAITWFLLAAVWLGMTVYLLWRIRQRTV